MAKGILYIMSTVVPGLIKTGKKMNNSVLCDFQTVKKAPAELVEKYRNKIPKQIVQIWEEYGFRSFMDGFLKTIHPDEFQDILQRAYFMGTESIPIFVTGLGDMIVWEENTYLTILRFRHGIFSVMAKGCNYFLDDLMDDGCKEEFFMPQNYYIALQNQGALEYDECFGYVPLLCLGGPEDAENLQKVKMLEHMELILAIGGKMV